MMCTCLPAANKNSTVQSLHYINLGKCSNSCCQRSQLLLMVGSWTMQLIVAELLFPVGSLTPAGASYAPLLVRGGWDGAARGRGE